MTAEQLNERLRYMAAKLALGELSAFEIKDEVDSLMNESIFHDDFLDVIDSKPPRMAEVREPFIRTLNRLGVEVPSKENAVWQLIHHHINRICSRQVDPTKGLCQLVADLDWDAHLGASHDLRSLFGFYWAYEELEQPPEIAFDNRELARRDLDILAEAKVWQEKFSSMRGGPL